LVDSFDCSLNWLVVQFVLSIDSLGGKSLLGSRRAICIFPEFWVLLSGCDFFHMHFWKVHFSWQLNSSGWSTRLVARLIGYWFDSFGDSILLAGG
jgi:hypothetical protein